MHRNHVNVSITSYHSLSPFLSKQWLQHSKIFKKKISQMGDLLNWQDNKKQCNIYENCACNVARNVSSIELEKLLHPDNLIICPKKKDKDFDNCLQPCPHILQYSKVVLQTCQNKGCMCKPVIHGTPKCQINDEIQTNLESEVHHTTITKNAKNQTSHLNTEEYGQKHTTGHRKSQISHSENSEPKTSSPSELSEENKSNTSQIETSDHSKTHINKTELLPPHASHRQSQMIHGSELHHSRRGSFRQSSNTKEKRMSIQYEMCKKNPCDPCPEYMRYCMPSNFEQLLQEDGVKDTKFMYCKNRDLCTCDMLDTEVLKKDIKLPGKYVCIQRPAVPKIAERTSVEEETLLEEEISKEEQESKEEEIILLPRTASSSTGCCCFKKKTGKKDSDKYIQTCGVCCSNKTCQKESFTSCCHANNRLNVCQINEPTTCDKVKNIWICSKCGKINNRSNTCRDRSSCPGNTIILPQTSGPGFCTDQADILKTLIKLEAKHNFRQIDNILQELNQQRNEIKKLNDMFQSIVDTKSRNSVINHEDSENSGLQNTQIYICEGCELDVNRNILRTIMTSDINQNFDEDEMEWEAGYQTADNNKYIKNIINKEKCTPTKTGKEIQRKNFDDKYIQNGDIKHNLPIRQQDFTELKEKKQKINSPTVNTNGVKSQPKYDDRLHMKVQTQKVDHLMKDEIETEKPYVEQFNKKNSERQPNECAFISWWKKSLTNLKQNRSREILKRKYRSLQKKISECKRSFTDSNVEESEENLKCNYKYIQNKANTCKTSLTNFKKTQNQDTTKCNYQYPQQKLNDCKESLKNLKQRCNTNTEKIDFGDRLQNKMTLCKIKENKSKKGIKNYFNAKEKK